MPNGHYQLTAIKAVRGKTVVKRRATPHVRVAEETAKRWRKAGWRVSSQWISE